jgi:HD-GYP domain-containing protein (c-di-GMP phosphodiesterase class II)
MLQEARELTEQHPQAAGVLSQEAYRLAQKSQDEHSVAEALLLMGIAAQKRGDLEPARNALLKASDGFRLLGSRSKEQQARALVGRVCLDLGLLEEAADILKQAIELAEQLGDARAKAETLAHYAGMLYAQEEYLAALQVSHRVLELQRSLGSGPGQADALGSLAVVYAKLGDYPKALALQVEAYNQALKVEADARRQARYLINIGVLYHETKDYASALEYLVQALGLTQEQGLHNLQVMAFNNAGFAAMRMGDLNAARQYFQKGLDLAQQIGMRSGEASALDGMGQLYIHKQDYAAAKGAHQLALKTALETGQSDLEIGSLTSLSKLSLALEQPQEALGYLERALGRAEESGDKKSAYEIHELLAEAHEKLSNYRKALVHHRTFYRIRNEVLGEETERQTRTLTLKSELELMRTEELEKTQIELVQRLARAADYRDDDTGEHTKRVGETAGRIAEVLGWPEDQVALLRLAAPLHDMGKIGIPDSILLKPGKYTPVEHNLMKAHTEIGAAILSGGRSKLLQMAEEIALSHHEHWDGSGYPRKLAGSSIPEAGRIVAVADVLDALINDRPYKTAWPLLKALQEIRQQSGKHFDPKIVEACLRVFQAQLADAERAEVAERQTPGA